MLWPSNASSDFEFNANLCMCSFSEVIISGEFSRETITTTSFDRRQDKPEHWYWITGSISSVVVTKHHWVKGFLDWSQAKNSSNRISNHGFVTNVSFHIKRHQPWFDMEKEGLRHVDFTEDILWRNGYQWRSTGQVFSCALILWPQPVIFPMMTYICLCHFTVCTHTQITILVNLKQDTEIIHCPPTQSGQPLS